jgi:hypothetical protein
LTPSNAHSARPSSPVDLIQKRVSEFPEVFCSILVQGDQSLFCKLCKGIISSKASTSRDHLKSLNHSKNCQQSSLDFSSTSFQSYVSFIEEYYKKEKTSPPSGVPLVSLAKRMALLRECLLSEIPLNSLDSTVSKLKDIFINFYDSDQLLPGIGAVSRRSISAMVPLLLYYELKSVALEIGSNSVAIVFDGSDKCCKLEAIMFKYFNETSFKVCTRLLSLKLYDHTLNGTSTAAYIAQELAKFDIAANAVRYFVRDGVSSNSLAVRQLSPLYSKSLDVICYSHSLSRCAIKVLPELPVLNKFLSYYICMVSKSSLARQLFSDAAGRKPRRNSKTRWGSKYLVAKDLLDHFKVVLSILTSPKEFSKENKQRMKHIVETNIKELYIELLFFSYCGKAFYEPLYELEGELSDYNVLILFISFQIGDGILAPFVYEKLQLLDVNLLRLLEGKDVDFREDLKAFLLSTSSEQPCNIDHAVKSEIDKMSKKLKSAVDKFHADFFGAKGKCTVTTRIYKGLRILNPEYVVQASDVELSSCVDCLMLHPAFKGCVIFKEKIMVEIPVLKVAASKTALNSDEISNFFKYNHSLIPNLYTVFKETSIFTPSSASAERLFNLYQKSFDKKKESSLEDLVELSLLVRCNSFQRLKSDYKVSFESNYEEIIPTISQINHASEGEGIETSLGEAEVIPGAEPVEWWNVVEEEEEEEEAASDNEEA